MRLEFADFNKLYDSKRVITNHKIIDLKDYSFYDDGLFSERLFGKKIDNENMTYQCECGNYKGKFHEGDICPKCKSPVVHNVSVLDNLAWINLKKYYIINPLFYQFLTKIIGSKNLESIIAYDNKIDRDGNVTQTISDKKGIYANIGMIEFRKKFSEIFKYYYKLSNYKGKEHIKKILQENKDLIFINKFPVYSPNLRPITFSFSDKPIVKFDEVNKAYASIIKLSNMINDENPDIEIIVLTNIASIQSKANFIFHKILENLSGKSGFIRNNTVGSRLNFSARNVITPMPAGYKIDDVILPYLTFVELYSFEIVNILSKLKQINMIEAYKIVKRAQCVFDKEVYLICKDMIKKTQNGCMILLNRNPTISYGSILALNVAGIKSDFNDLTTSIHNCILTPLAGDYDGDTLNIIAIFDNTFKRMFRETFSPTKMFVSNDDGKFNRDLSLDRDQIIGIRNFLNL